MTPEEELINEQNRATPSNGIVCELDGVYVHEIATYLKHHHPTVSLADYRLRFPEAPIMSPTLEAKIQRKRNTMPTPPPAETASTTPPPTPATIAGYQHTDMATQFGLRANTKALQSALGHPLQVYVREDSDIPPQLELYKAQVDNNYINQPDIIRSINMAVMLNIPMLIWGYHGTGKTTAIEQFMARTNRPWMRVQHTVSTEEAHVLGQYTVKTCPETKQNIMVFEPGPLAVAMREGLVYCADEYDFALPSVTSVYQPVLEGKPLLIKEAPPEWRMVKPHPNFRFFATGNTNGSGDETGLYQGTQIMNAANYSRFGITVQMKYMEADMETAVVAKQSGLQQAEAKKFVQFARDVRAEYESGKLSVTISPRELINAARISLVLGYDHRGGIQLAYSNRLSTNDRKGVDNFAQRVFGGATV